MDIYKTLNAVQVELKAPKGRMNKFGGYKYRSCEDILEAAKPILNKHKLTLSISDEPTLIGERYYIKATATVSTESGETLSVNGYAREEDVKKGMDSAQVTGSTSSYARKYALNGLFLIDDTQDPDTEEYTNESVNRSKAENKKPDLAKETKAEPKKADAKKTEDWDKTLEKMAVTRLVNEVEIAEINALCKTYKKDPKAIAGYYKRESIGQMSLTMYEDVLKIFEDIRKKNEEK